MGVRKRAFGAFGEAIVLRQVLVAGASALALSAVTGAAQAQFSKFSSGDYTFTLTPGVYEALIAGASGGGGTGGSSGGSGSYVQAQLTLHSTYTFEVVVGGQGGSASYGGGGGGGTFLAYQNGAALLVAGGGGGGQSFVVGGDEAGDQGGAGGGVYAGGSGINGGAFTGSRAGGTAAPGVGGAGGYGGGGGGYFSGGGGGGQTGGDAGPISVFPCGPSTCFLGGAGYAGTSGFNRSAPILSGFQAPGGYNVGDGFAEVTFESPLAAPEPSAWFLMLAGAGLIGGATRLRRAIARGDVTPLGLLGYRLRRRFSS